LSSNSIHLNQAYPITYNTQKRNCRIWSLVTSVLSQLWNISFGLRLNNNVLQLRQHTCHEWPRRQSLFV